MRGKRRREEKIKCLGGNNDVFITKSDLSNIDVIYVVVRGKRKRSTGEKPLRKRRKAVTRRCRRAA